MTTVAAFDPGLTGAVAILHADGRASVHDLPTLELPGNWTVGKRLDCLALGRLVRREVPADLALATCCESIRAMGNEGERGLRVASLMRAFGAIEATCDLLRAPAELIDPQSWQRFFGLAGKNVEAQARERGALPRTVTLAAELYPHLADRLARVKDHNRAEAVLIGHYFRRKVLGL